MARHLVGNVVSTKMDKTAVVVVTHSKSHPLYQKRYTVSKKFLVHDPMNELKVGQKVTITETRPMSKRKRWIVAQKAVVARKGQS